MRLSGSSSKSCVNGLGINVQGFGDMSVDEVAALTGLTRDEAKLAKNREFTEPFIFPEGPDGRFLQAFEGRETALDPGPVLSSHGRPS